MHFVNEMNKNDVFRDADILIIYLKYLSLLKIRVLSPIRIVKKILRLYIFYLIIKSRYFNYFLFSGHRHNSFFCYFQRNL